MYNLEFVRSESLTDNISSFWFRPDQIVRYQPGQYAEFYIPHENIDNLGTHRWFTLSSSPTEELIGITTKFFKPISSFKSTLKSLKIGDKIKMSEPQGDFILPKDKTLPLLFIAGGTGITPVRSILKYLIDSHQVRDISLIYVVANKKDIIFKDLINDSNVSYYSLITDKSNINDKTGINYITAGNISALVPNYFNRLSFISGSGRFTYTVNKELKSLDVPYSRITLDNFLGYENEPL